MGDRGQIIIDDELYFYTHHVGSDIPTRVALALDRSRDRWDDPDYLNRVIFCDLVGKENWEETTGFGIGVKYMDSDNQDLYIDTCKFLITWQDYNYEYEEFIEKFGKEQE
jgi:hypothetical protein